MSVLQILWATDLERGVMHTPAKGMRFVRSRGHGRVESFSFNLRIHSFGTRPQHWPGPKQFSYIVSEVTV
jgi:hypothetical protein